MEKLTSINIKSIVAKINELITYTLKNSKEYDDSKLVERIKALEDQQEYRYNDKPIVKMITDIAKRQDDLSRTQNMLDKSVKAIEIPKVPSIEPLRKRIKALEDKPQYIYDDRSIKDRLKSLESKPQSIYNDKPLVERVKKLEAAPKYVYDDSEVKSRIKALESEAISPVIEVYDDSELVDRLSGIEKSIESLDKRLDFVRRTYSEKWERSEFERDKFQKTIGSLIAEMETPQEVDLSEIEKSIDEIKGIASRPVDLSGVHDRLKKLEDRPSYFYNDKPLIREIDIIKAELSETKNSINEILE